MGLESGISMASDEAVPRTGALGESTGGFHGTVHMYQPWEWIQERLEANVQLRSSARKAFRLLCASVRARAVSCCAVSGCLNAQGWCRVPAARALLRSTCRSGAGCTGYEKPRVQVGVERRSGHVEQQARLGESESAGVSGVAMAAMALFTNPLSLPTHQPHLVTHFTFLPTKTWHHRSHGFGYANEPRGTRGHGTGRQCAFTTLLLSTNSLDTKEPPGPVRGAARRRRAPPLDQGTLYVYVLPFSQSPSSNASCSRHGSQQPSPLYPTRSQASRFVQASRPLYPIRLAVQTKSRVAPQAYFGCWGCRQARQGPNYTQERRPPEKGCFAHQGQPPRG